MEKRESTEAQVNELLNQLTLEEKIALTIGQNFWSTNSVERLGIPSIALNDGPHGIRKPNQGDEIAIGNSIPATCFPTAVSLASSWDTDLAYEIGQALGQECLALDVQVLLGPGVNIKRTPLGGRNFEYFSEDPVVAGEMGTAWVKGVQSQGVGTSLKHYACNNQEWERMTINAEIDQRTLREIYLTAFEQVVKQAQPWTIMAAYNKINGIYAAEHPQLLNDILKQEWGFKGVAVSDWGAVNEKGKALEAGLDLEMPGPVYKHAEKIARLVHDGELSEASINAAVARVLGLVLQGMAQRKPGYSFDQTAHHELARRAAADSIVLLKNTDNILPLKTEKLTKIAVLGRFAKQPRYQGAGSSQVNPTRFDSTFEELQKWLGDKVSLTYADGYEEEDQFNQQLLEDAINQARQADVALIFAGLPNSFESEGFDRDHIFMPASHNKLIEEVCRTQPNTVVILHNGSVVAMPWIDSVKAVLETGLGGQAVGAAIVDILSGKVNPSGRLAETFPIQLEDTPAWINYPGELGVVRYGEGIFVGYRYYDKKKIRPLFPFGFGLSYTTFAYTELKTDKPIFQDGETLEVKVSVKNTGTLAGKEVVQLYVRSLASQFARPVRELKAFAKVELQPGETKEVLITLNDRAFRVYDRERQDWRLEGGEYQIEIGGSAKEPAISTKITVVEDPQSARRIFNRMTEVKYFLQDAKARKTLFQTFEGKDITNLLNEENKMFIAIPISKIANFGNISDELIDELILKVNQS